MINEENCNNVEIIVELIHTIVQIYEINTY